MSERYQDDLKCDRQLLTWSCCCAWGAFGRGRPPFNILTFAELWRWLRWRGTTSSCPDRRTAFSRRRFFSSGFTTTLGGAFTLRRFVGITFLRLFVLPTFGTIVLPTFGRVVIFWATSSSRSRGSFPIPRRFGPGFCAAVFHFYTEIISSGLSGRLRLIITILGLNQWCWIIKETF